MRDALDALTDYRNWQIRVAWTFIALECIGGPLALGIEWGWRSTWGSLSFWGGFGWLFIMGWGVLVMALDMWRRWARQ